MGERLFYTQKVIGSIPISPTIYKDEMKNKLLIANDDPRSLWIFAAIVIIHYVIIPLMGF